MRTPRDVFRFKNALAELQELASAQNAKESDVENIELTADQICEVEKFRCGELRHTQLSRTVSMWLSFESLNTRRKNPIFFSDLPVLLEQETWSPNDALLILAGVDPRGAVLDWNTENHLGAETGRPQIKHAIWFTSTSDLYDYPVPEDFENSAKDYENATQDLIENKSSTQEVQKLLKRADDWKKWSNDKTSIFKSKTLALRSELVYILKRRWESGDHDPSIRRTPMFFVR
ncbi:hypothetical protein [Acidovorax kalamii]|uniref:hypothetical protein n=1 Tax=Acidovorax kalamii TaxID=2004485 RepID=UPI0010557DE1|nr:hypothetical protein [Acidovorax kalamii]